MTIEYDECGIVTAGSDMSIVDFFQGQVADGQTVVVLPLSKTINTGNSFPVILGGQADDSSYYASFFNVTLTSTHATVTFGPTQSLKDYSFMVVESGQLVSLQFVEWNNNGTSNATITRVDSVNNRVVVFPSAISNILQGEHAVTFWPVVTWVDSTNVTTLTGNRGLPHNFTYSIKCYVAEFKK